ncbi:MAG: hypothetical protein QOD63_1491, partial [Actinomycetota bacterium]|nr:hypothetical protein [Actinomycetota bacterium]
MTSVYAGPYQGDLRDLGGAALVGASVQVRIAGTATPATLYNKSVAVAVAGSGDSLGNPLPAAAGEGLPGIDSGGSVAFFAATLAADGTAAAYDLVVTYGSYVLGPFRVYAAPSPLELAVKLPVFSPGAPAAGSASGKDKAAVQAALAAWTASTRGGTVFFVGGSWDVGDLQLPLSQDLDKPLNYEGEGKSSYFKFSVDKGLGTFAIKGGDTIPSGGSCNSTISNIY